MANNIKLNENVQRLRVDWNGKKKKKIKSSSSSDNLLENNCDWILLTNWSLPNRKVIVPIA